MKLKLLTLLLLTSILSFAQNKKVIQKNKVADGKVFINLASGLDNPFGLIGIGITGAVKPTILGHVGLGSSSWGLKLTLGGTYFFKPHYKGSALALSLNYSNGLTQKNTSVSNNNTGSTVKLDIKGTSAISTNLMYAYYMNMGKKSKFYIQTGIAFHVNNPSITMYHANTSSLYIDNDITAVYKLLRPGGLVANIGFQLALQ